MIAMVALMLPQWSSAVSSGDPVLSSITPKFSIVPSTASGTTSFISPVFDTYDPSSSAYWNRLLTNTFTVTSWNTDYSVNKFSLNMCWGGTPNQGMHDLFTYGATTTPITGAGQTHFGIAFKVIDKVASSSINYNSLIASWETQSGWTLAEETTTGEIPNCDGYNEFSSLGLRVFDTGATTTVTNDKMVIAAPALWWPGQLEIANVQYYLRSAYSESGLVTVPNLVINRFPNDGDTQYQYGLMTIDNYSPSTFGYSSDDVPYEAYSVKIGYQIFAPGDNTPYTNAIQFYGGEIPDICDVIVCSTPPPSYSCPGWPFCTPEGSTSTASTTDPTFRPGPTLPHDWSYYFPDKASCESASGLDYIGCAFSTFFDWVSASATGFFKLTIDATVSFAQWLFVPARTINWNDITIADKIPFAYYGYITTVGSSTYATSTHAIDLGGISSYVGEVDVIPTPDKVGLGDGSLRKILTTLIILTVLLMLITSIVFI